jgi:hypothetical protein
VLAGLALLSALAGTASLGACSDGGEPERPPQAIDRLWPAPADAAAAAENAGLEMLDREMLDVHYHAHLDVIVEGGAVRVPPNIGIDVNKRTITALHTHDATGIIHIESAADIPFTLGQFFAEWGQPLTATEVGQVTVPAGSELRVYRNGSQTEGDPAKLRLRAHDQLVVWVGPKDEKPQVPSSYAFPEGL